MSRRPRGELQFGSDSFLDVVANIVGILIILIVIAGLRVSQMPALPPSTVETESDPAVETVPVPVAPATSPIEIPQEVASLPVEPEEEIEEPVPTPPPLPPLEAPRELVDATQNLESELASIHSEEAKLTKRMKLTREEHEALLERQERIKKMIAEKSATIIETKKQAAVAEADLELARETLSRLAKQVRELELTPANVETLEHKITPVSRLVNGKEKHYRLEKNRVSEVPIEELVNRFREQIDRRKEFLVKTRQYQGEIGPLQGFNMRYHVRVDSMSDLDAARAGHGGYRISLSSWEIHPEPGHKGETAEIALRRGSKFYQSILGTSPDTTLTFWVYPDSYPLYRSLQKFTHEHGYSVAGRPLPEGVPIAGSPNGSKSASQ
ncbi:hypothetical protein [Schlesneria paludicola]|uniref:hypothetical protein n=1 Tax=Schlesneria paludicola TaxID=360056 RepID=UPI00029AF145|nr:hypothetical protein [Schlesneria paludicola]